ncbi:DUF2971 domain-containing protein [Chromobacterium haemolyticum]|uniref:DUF2971 domain-containing protein n=1 Tax=Chromobacterium haemolyticum TaxID=394935 RepID=UPI004055F0CB
MKDLDGVVYKYYGFYDYVIRSLMADEIYFSSCDQFNDVYENHFGIEDISRYIAPEVEDKEKVKRDNLDYFFRFPELVRVFCASTRCNNSLMWAHYAAQHSGFCVAYSVEELMKSTVYRFQDNSENVVLKGCMLHGSIDYFESPPQISSETVVKFYESKGKDGTALNDIIDTVFYCKSKDWEYEQEYRFAIPTGLAKGNIFLKYPREAVRGVAFGVRAKNDNMNWIMSLFSGVKYYKAKITLGKYEVDFEQI